MPLRVAVVGTGNISNVHLSVLKRVGVVDVVGVHDQDPARARERAEQHGVSRVYDSWNELLKDETVDCVAVLLPQHVHEQHVVEALSAGKHVVCEKPIGHTLEVCDRMLAAAERSGRMLFPVHNRVYDWAAERMGEIVKAGQIGEVYLAQTNGYEGPTTVTVRPWLGTRAAGGGVLLAQAVHPAYVLRWILGDIAKVACLFGDIRTVPDMETDDTAVATLKFASGALAEMTATFGIEHGPFDHSIELHGRDGYLRLAMNRQRDQAHPHLLDAISPQLFGDKELHRVDVRASDGWGTGFERMWADYARAMTEGSTPRQNGVDGVRAVEIILAAYESNQSGRVVELPLRR